MPVSIRQAAAIPVRDGLVLMATSRNGRRWVVPKGRIEPGQRAGEAALMEAWEEAGLLGLLDGEPVGSYHYEKDGRDHHVLVFVMRVTEQKADYPERGTRQLEWVTPEEAVRRIDEHGLRVLVREVFRSGQPVAELEFA
jgi:8-oxo-dGTP pyrophosphatase MutT (NUDIX family)